MKCHLMTLTVIKSIQPILQWGNFMSVKIEQVTPEFAQKLCCLITSDLPEYFGLLGAN